MRFSLAQAKFHLSAGQVAGRFHLPGENFTCPQKFFVGGKSNCINHKNILLYSNSRCFLYNLFKSVIIHLCTLGLQELEGINGLRCILRPILQAKLVIWEGHLIYLIVHIMTKNLNFSLLEYIIEGNF